MWWRRALALSFLVLTASPSALAQAIEEPAHIAAAAERFVQHELPASSRATARVRAVPLDARLRLARCGGPLEATWSAGAAASARTSVQVRCTVGATWRIHVPVTVRSRVEALVLVAPAARGASLGARDVAVKTFEVDGLAHLYIRSLDEIAGRHLARAAPAAVPLRATWFAADKIVARGQQVTLVATADGIRIRAVGRALSDGAAQDRVRVQNLSSLKVVEGIVENDGEVRVTPR
ncbi:MAG: flagellar basal body P-ring formation chaperone FlgA [Steroidobacteraceae bacterium]